jgi:hypothetical protein
MGTFGEGTKIEVYKKFRAELNRKEIEESKTSNAPNDFIKSYVLVQAPSFLQSSGSRS